MKNLTSVFAMALLTSGTLGYDVPSNVQSFLNRVKGEQGGSQCPGGGVLQDGLTSKEDGSSSFAYCQDTQTGALYIHGNNQLFTNMDVDCDGDQADPGDGRCGSSGDTQSETAFQDQVQQYSQFAGNYVSDLNADYIPYVVFGNYGTRSGYVNFHPEDVGLQPLSVMAVICPQSDGSSQMVYGVWGDTNGDDDARAVVGEASISLATACFGDDINGDSGHDQDDVLYIAFPGSVGDTVHKHANWAAKSFDDFESSIKDTGDALVARLS